MAYIYMDESGDLWFNRTKSRTSRFFIITFLIVKDDKIPNLVMKKAFNWMKHKNIKLKSWVFHAFSHLDSTIKKVLNIAIDYDISIMSLVLDKNKIYSLHTFEKHILYNIIVNKLLDAVINKNLLDSDHDIIHFSASRRETSKTLNEQFINYLKNRHIGQPNILFEIQTPHQSKWLQLVDTISFSMYQKYEHCNDDFYKIFAKKIRIEDEFFN